ncbi:MAG: hypothetical protein JRI25_21970 [Deltaproteobacteria bacterium]|nr:hypothetical protein [Deltaproteobacteria bacterium]MBW2257241.1 hypothetical protein [Deltaproteobacteria bacterium]
MRVLPILLLLGACYDEGPTDHSGTAVGNPGKLGMGVTEPADMVLLRAEADVEELMLRRCGDGWEAKAVDRVLDLLEPDDVLLTLPAGLWCGLDVVLAPVEGLVLVGETAGGTTFEVRLEPGRVALHGAFRVDGNQLLVLFPVGDALNAGVLEDLGPDVVLSADDPVAQGWASVMEEGAELWEDEDRDGVVDPDESLVAWADPDIPAAAFDEDGCGCASGSGGALGWLLLLPGVAVGSRRRRRTTLR